MQTFNVIFSGFDPETHRKTIKRYRVKAADSYQATDKLDAQHHLRDRFVGRCFQFGKSTLPANSISAKVARRAGPEEE